MTKPIFNINYQSAYTAEIEFQTQINEMQTGFEQRYPKWTYPKRIFTLKFDKNFKGRQEIEDFFVDVMSQAGTFYWTWEQEKGGNGQTYECWFDVDNFEQNIKDLGYTETSLKLICIDKSPVTQIDELDVVYQAESSFNLEFKRIVDKIFSAQNNMKTYWQAPKRQWTLKFDKNKTNRELLEKFFISKRGRFKSFDWKWKKELGGDDNVYTVRFDNDSLSMDIMELGYGKFELKLKEVFKDENPYLSEYEKPEIIPRKLLKIELKGGSIYVLDNETLEELVYNGETYIGAPLQHGDLKKDDNSAVSQTEIIVSNVALAISAIIGNRGDVITNAPALLTQILLDVNTNTIINNTPQVLFAGRCNNLQLDYENAKMDIQTELGGFEKVCPVMRYRPTCQVRRFKDIRCKYAGTEFTSCDRTFASCKERNNTANFRGFPSVVYELTIKV